MNSETSENRIKKWCLDCDGDEWMNPNIGRRLRGGGQKTLFMGRVVGDGEPRCLDYREEEEDKMVGWLMV